MKTKMKMKTAKGFARWTASTQQFLDTCPAVMRWVATADKRFVEFDYDPAVEVPLVPAGIYFDPDRAEPNELAALGASLLHHEIDRLDECDLCGTKEEKVALHEILAGEGFGGREDDVRTFDEARAVAGERLAWLRLVRADGPWDDPWRGEFDEPAEGIR